MEQETQEDLDFDFITDQGFRNTLESDYREMLRCREVGSWKAVHVLAGSIVEAVLVDYLIGTANQKQPDPLGMSLGELIAACKKKGVLSKKSSDLTSALKEYRNLIHPGRAKRLNDSADAEGANVAQSLVRMIVSDIATKQAETHGLTAEQIATKFESDPTAAGIAEHLLKEAADKEIERLLLEIVPQHYFAELEHEFITSDDVLRAHELLFHAAFGHASPVVKRKVLAQYVTVLKEDPGPRVRVYERVFFRAPYIAHVDEDDAALVKHHLFSQLDDEEGNELLAAARGIGEFLVEEDVTPFVDPLVRAAIRDRGSQRGKLIVGFLKGEYSNTPSDIDDLIVARLDDWIGAYEARADGGDVPQLELLREIRDTYAIPF